MSRVLVVESEKPRISRTFVFECRYQSDLVRFLAALDKAGGLIIQITGSNKIFPGEWMVVYRHTEEIETEVMT